MAPQPAHNGKAIVKSQAGQWSIEAKQRFIALCEQWPDHDTVMELCHKIVGWPLKKSKSSNTSPTAQGTMLVPSDNVLDMWWNEWACGEAKPDPKVAEMIRTRVDRYMALEETLTRRKSLKVVQHYQEKALTNSLSVAEQVAMKYAYDGAGFLKTSLGEPKQQAMQVGKLNINFGQKPEKKPASNYQKRRQEKALTEGVVIGEFRELDGNG